MTDDDLRGVVNRAAFLHERLGPTWLPAPNPFDGAAVEARLARWRQVAAGGDGEHFTRRLAWLGLDEATARRIAGAGGYAPGTPLPDWALFLAGVVDSAADLRADGIVPAFGRAAEDRLSQAAGAQLAWLAPPARQSLADYLADGLEHLARLTFSADNNRSLADLCQHYPVLARQLAQRSLDWTAEVADFLARLGEDWPALSRRILLPAAPAPGAVTALTPGLSDPHRGGRTVWRVELASGATVAYKPKSLALDRAWNELIVWCNQRGLAPPLAHLWTLPRPGYGWMEWAGGDGENQNTDFADFRRFLSAPIRPIRVLFSEQAGMLLGLLHLLHAADCHPENLAAHAGQPLLVDAEMLVYPQFAGRESDDPLDVLRTGLLPRWALHGHEWAEIGGLPRGVDRQAVVAGYDRLWAFVAQHWGALNGADGPLASFRRAEVRVAPRPTAAYARLLAHLRQPACLGDGMDFSIQADRLAHAYLAQPSQEGLWPLLAAEHRAIAQGDVPLFFGAVGRPALGFAGGAIPNALTWPAFALPTAARQHQQAGLIQASLDPSPWLPSAPASFLDTARQLGEALAARAIALEPGGVGWAAPQFQPKSRLWQHGLVGEDLYAGRAGIALFLAGLFQATGEARWRELALAGLAGDDRSADDPGGRIYALALAARFLQEPTPAARAEALARRLSPQEDSWRSAAYPWGVLDGEAGLLLGLLALHRQTAGPVALPAAVACGERLLRGEEAWAHPAHALGGFSHGAAGIAHALTQLFRATGETRFLDGARRGWKFQRALYDDGAGNWQDRRGAQPVYLHNWCNGAAGIGLAAAGCASDQTSQVGGQSAVDMPDPMARPPDRSSLPKLMDVAERAAALLMQPDSLPFLDTLCCGGFGQMESLLEMGRLCQRPEWVMAATAQAREVLARATRAGSFALYDDLPAHLFNPGLFRGAAGIGYTFLRLAAANRETAAEFPSVLGFGD